MNAMIQRLDSLYAAFLRLAGSLQSPFLLLIRLYWGWQFFQTGWGKLHNIGKVVEFFTGLGIPAPSLNAHFVALLETTGGILLILGLGSRLIAFPLVINMMVAYLTADREALSSIFSEPSQFYNAAPYTFLFASLLVLIFGPGWFALDTLVRWYWKKNKNHAPVGSSAS
jgi:putative oxidoreductase